ncbi:MAG: hypothetical protein AAFQ80_02205 [Cyanobacteria bacterium J06621_8]
MPTVQSYFLKIAQEYQQILEKVAFSWSSQEKLEQACLSHRLVAIAKLKNIHPPTHFVDITDRSVGLNSVGLLLDRLSILSIKVWCLQYLENSPLDAIQLCNQQILDIAGALSEALPAKNSLNSKLTIYQTSIEADEWESAVYDLMITNLLIWKAQEPLYCGSSIEATQQFPTYLSLFPEINLKRDSLICRCELLYWSAFQKNY